MKRNKHSLSHYRLLTGDMGELLPIGCYEVLPGDTIQQGTSMLLRVSPLLAPVMHPVQVRVHHWFVPYRILWDDWEAFITGGPDGMNTDTPPTITAPGADPGPAGWQIGSLPDYLGIPTEVADLEVQALPVRAYNKIFNEYYRDQDLVTAVAEDSTVVQKVAWEKDYFTSARPWSQKGPEVTLPLGTSAPVVANDQDGIQLKSTNDLYAPLGLSGTATGNNVIFSGSMTGVNSLKFDPNYPTGLEADLSDATAVSVNAVREAFALQRYEEARARYGSRYTEYLRYLGVRSSDARLQRPEYLGGGKQTISFSEVLQTGPFASGLPEGAEGVATLRGHGISALRSRRYRRFFEEHGVVLSLMSVRPRSMYVNGVHRMWNRATKEDFWQKELEHIGQQEIMRREVYAGSSGEEPFGYQDRYAEYRHHPSQVTGEFRDTLDYWHMARIFGSEPSLNADFVTCDPTKRINAVQSEDVLWIMASHSIQARRMVSRNASGRII